LIPGSLEVRWVQGELPLKAAAAAAAVNEVFKLTGPGPAPQELILDGILVPTVEAVWGFSSSRIVIIWSVNTIQ
jgi:hypothetical protein